MCCLYDVCFKLGDKTRVKIKEILSDGGKYWRNTLREEDERFKVLGSLGFMLVGGRGRQCGHRVISLTLVIYSTLFP